MYCRDMSSHPKAKSSCARYALFATCRHRKKRLRKYNLRTGEGRASALRYTQTKVEKYCT